MSLPSELGQNILVIMDNCLDMLQTAVIRMTDVSRKSFTLLHCCPPIYWEHGGPNPDAQRTIRSVWQSDECEFRATYEYFNRASRLLQRAGVFSSAIHMQTALEGNVVDATMAELRRGNYWG